MALLNKLRSARESYAVKLQKFMQIYSKNSNITICFFEGEDIKYYGSRINMICSSLTWEGLSCNGKATVLELREKISNHEVYSKASTMYFVDRDFDNPREYSKYPSVYITPCYSIENLYVTQNAFKKILKSEFGFNEHLEDDNSFGVSLQLFQDRLQEFLDAAQDLNSWILYHRRRENQEGDSQTKLNLQSLKLNQLISISLSAVVSNYKISDLESYAQDARPVTKEEINQLSQEFETESRYLDFRGKYQAFFMRTFLTQLREDACKQKPEFLPYKKTLAFNVSDRNFLSDLCQYAETPPCLQAFLATINSS